MKMTKEQQKKFMQELVEGAQRELQKAHVHFLRDQIAKGEKKYEELTKDQLELLEKYPAEQ